MIDGDRGGDDSVDPICDVVSSCCHHKNSDQTKFYTSEYSRQDSERALHVSQIMLHESTLAVKRGSK